MPKHAFFSELGAGGTGAGYRGAWVALTPVVLNEMRSAPDGSLIFSLATRTTRASYDATEITFWQTLGIDVSDIEADLLLRPELSTNPADAGKAIDAYTGTPTEYATTASVDAISVMTQGAVGDGSADDSVAIQATVTQALILGKDTFLPGNKTFIAKALTLENSTMRGPGTLKLKAAAGSNVALITLGNDATLEGLRIDGNGAAQTDDSWMLINVTGDDATVRKLRITGARSRCIEVQQGAEDATIEHNRLIGNGITSSCTGIQIKGSYAKVTKNLIKDHFHLGHGIRVGRFDTDEPLDFIEGVEVEGNHVRRQNGTGGGGTGIICEAYSRGTTVTGNHVADYDHAVKCDDAVSTTITANTFRDISTTTAFNFINSYYTKFIGNDLRDCASGPLMGFHGTCSENTLINVGSASGQVIRSYGPQGVVADNVLTGCTTILAQIRIGPDTPTSKGYTVTGNQIENGTGPATTYGVYADKCSNINVSENIITGSGVTHGVRIVSTVSEYECRANQMPDAATKYELASATGTIHASGAGDPNGVWHGYPGSTYNRTGGGTGTSLYVKETGAGTNTGWVAK